MAAVRRMVWRFCGTGRREKPGLDQSEQVSVLRAVSFDTQEKKCVFSPFSLNAKLVGHLYECLAPTEGEVRGARVCAYACMRFLLAWLLVSAIS